MAYTGSFKLLQALLVYRKKAASALRPAVTGPGIAFSNRLTVKCLLQINEPILDFSKSGHTWKLLSADVEVGRVYERPEAASVGKRLPTAEDCDRRWIFTPATEILGIEIYDDRTHQKIGTFGYPPGPRIQSGRLELANGQRLIWRKSRGGAEWRQDEKRKTPLIQYESISKSNGHLALEDINWLMQPNASLTIMFGLYLFVQRPSLETAARPPVGTQPKG